MVQVVSSHFICAVALCGKVAFLGSNTCCFVQCAFPFEPPLLFLFECVSVCVRVCAVNMLFCTHRITTDRDLLMCFAAGIGVVGGISWVGL